MDSKPDMLELAVETLRDITGATAPLAFSAQAQFAQAAALIALAEQAKRIADALEKAQGEDGLFRVEARNYDVRRELG